MKLKDAFRSRRIVAGAIVVAALAGGAVALGATRLASDGDERAIIEDAARQLGVEPGRLSNALKDAYATRIDAAVEAGRLTEAEGAELKRRIEAGDVPLVGIPGSFHHFGNGFGHGNGFGPENGFGHGQRHGPFRALEAAAGFLDLGPAELGARFEAGKSLADIAREQGKTVDALKAAITDAITADLDAAVADGRITVDQKRRLLEELAPRLDDLVTGTGFGMRHGPDHDGDWQLEPGFVPD